MQVIKCSGTPYEIGYTHGSLTRDQIRSCIAFYTRLFTQNCALSWPAVLEHAVSFAENVERKWPAFYEEIKGVAEGAEVGVLDVVALNVRTEINFGLFEKGMDEMDGCTALAWRTGKGKVWAGQNWDWQAAQKENLIVLEITQQGKPTIVQVTEAGIIGKIGFNSAGVGTLLNAIRVPGVDEKRLPVHFGLRIALECGSVGEAIRKLEDMGMASSAHIMLADSSTAVGLEFTKSTFAHCELNGNGRIVHTNHLLLEHPGETDTIWLKDSLVRIQTMVENAAKLRGEPTWQEISALFQDEQHYPASICRLETNGSESETLFNIIMNLSEKKAIVRLGRPGYESETLNLQL